MSTGVNAGEKMHQRAGVKLHQDGMPRPPSEGFCWTTNRMRSVLPHRRMLPRHRALPHRPCSRCLTDLLAEPQLPFSIPIQNASLMLALWSCGRRAGVVQAQRQIHRAFAASYAATYALRRTRHADPPNRLPVDENRPGAIKPGFGCRSAELLVAGAGVACSV